jgi:hypothetical protein
LVERVRRLVRAIREGEEAKVEQAILSLSQSRRWLAPVAFAVGAFVMLFDGLKLVFSNWLTVVQVLPAMWIWLAMLDLKVHVLHGKSFIVRHGPVAVAVVAAITAITAAAFFLNAVFPFAIAEPGPPEIRPAFARARAHRRVVVGSGAVVGVFLGLSTIVVTRWGRPWFTLSLGVVIGVMIDLLRRRALEADRHQNHPFKEGQARRQRGRRRTRSGGLHAPVRARSHRNPDARVAFTFDPGDRPARCRVHAGGRRNRRRQGDQDERQARRRARAGRDCHGARRRTTKRPN